MRAQAVFAGNLNRGDSLGLTEGSGDRKNPHWLSRHQVQQPFSFNFLVTLLAAAPLINQNNP